MPGVLPAGMALAPAHLLYLADMTGDFSPGRSADLVRLRAPQVTPLAAAVECSGSSERLLAAPIAQAGAESVRAVRIRGKAVAL